jgi:hypothetical protein
MFVIHSLSKNYIPCGPHLSLIKYFFKETLTSITPILGANKRYFEDTDRINREEKAKNKSPTFEKG